MNKLRELEACGQSVWLDDLSRGLIESGRLRRLVEDDGLTGVTSNPSIFEKAIGETEEYAGAIKAFSAAMDRSIKDIYEHLVIEDIRNAADILRSVYERTGGADGFVSLECSPHVANDTAATILEAQHLWASIDRPNLMVKVPATSAGIPAIRKLIAHGMNINVTLLFSVEAYEQVVDAYAGGLEELKAQGGRLSSVSSVASFFVSRIDTACEKRLEEIGGCASDDRLRGKTAVANAKLAYDRYRSLISSKRWLSLALAGARPQRLLWASTSAKNPAFRDTIYVDELIGRDTVNTMPPKTMDAFRDHGDVIPDSIEQGLDNAKQVLEELSKRGVSLKEITDALVVDGVEQFAAAFDKLLKAIARRRQESM